MDSSLMGSPGPTLVHIHPSQKLVLGELNVYNVTLGGLNDHVTHYFH